MNRKFFTGLAAIALVCAATTVGAQPDPNYTLNISSGGTGPGGTVTLSATLDIASTGGDLAGWSYGVCSNPAEVTVGNIGNGNGAMDSTSTAKNGADVDFNEIGLFPDGFTQGVVICFTGCAVILPGVSGFVMATADYTVDAAAMAPSTISIAYCDETLGTPPVANVVVVMGGSIEPVQNGGEINVNPCDDPVFDYNAADAGNFNYPAPAGIGGSSNSVIFAISEVQTGNPCSGVFPSETQGFSMGVSSDANVHSPTSVDATGVLAAADAGNGPEFLETSVFPNGWTAGCVYSFTGQFTIGFANAGDVIAVGYEGAAGALAGVEGLTTTPLTWDSGLGSPPVANVVVVGGGSFAANFNDGSVTYNGTTTEDFIRGDSNDDGIVNIADIIWLLSELFTGGPVTNCMLADDANADGAADAADAITIANYVFSSGPAPAAPFPGCGQVPGQTPTDCVNFNNCP